MAPAAARDAALDSAGTRASTAADSSGAASSDVATDVSDLPAGSAPAGEYEVYSRSQDATSYDLSGTMRYFVRFTQGDTAAIGFHAPVGTAIEVVV